MDKQNKKIPQLCGKDLCTACHACYNICSKKSHYHGGRPIWRITSSD